MVTSGIFIAVAVFTEWGFFAVCGMGILGLVAGYFLYIVNMFIIKPASNAISERVVDVSCKLFASASNSSEGKKKSQESLINCPECSKKILFDKLGKCPFCGCWIDDLLNASAKLVLSRRPITTENVMAYSRAPDKLDKTAIDKLIQDTNATVVAWRAQGVSDVQV